MKLRIGVEGCCHGELNKVFKRVKEVHKKNPLDLLIILGDFQSLRNEVDFKSISVPPKYRKLGDFPAYYRGEMSAPIPTIFIGGNHESMRHLMLLPYGGYVAKNIYYLGYSNVIWFKGVRIGSLSGIFKEWDFNKTRLNWNQAESKNWEFNTKSLYHVRKPDVFPLFLIQNRIDLMLSHDWPNEVVYHGNLNKLLKLKPFFKKDINNHELGSAINWELLKSIKPKWWFSAHLHVKFTANVRHDENSKFEHVKKNDNEIELDLFSEDDADETTDLNVVTQESVTKFLSLDKCLPKREWFEVIEIEPDVEHISFKKKNMYWDQEYIENLRYFEKNKSTLLKLTFNQTNWKELSKKVERFANPHVDQFLIPDYIDGIQKAEQDQTIMFAERFLDKL